MSMYFVRFRIRSFAFDGSLSLGRENSGPHAGMSFEPRASTLLSPAIVLKTCIFRDNDHDFVAPAT
jgi:hypothetical protein